MVFGLMRWNEGSRRVLHSFNHVIVSRLIERRNQVLLLPNMHWQEHFLELDWESNPVSLTWATFQLTSVSILLAWKITGESPEKTKWRNHALFNYSKALCLLLVSYNRAQALGRCLRAFITDVEISWDKDTFVGLQPQMLAWLFRAKP